MFLLVCPLPSWMAIITRHCQDLASKWSMLIPRWFLHILTVSTASFSDDSAPELALERPIGFETAHTWATDGITMVTKRWMLHKSVSKCSWDDGMDCACGWVPAFKQLHVHMAWQARLGVDQNVRWNYVQTWKKNIKWMRLCLAFPWLIHYKL